MRKLAAEAKTWPESDLAETDFAALAGLASPRLVCHVSILVMPEAPADLGPILRTFDFGDTAASLIGGGSAQICSDFRIRPAHLSRIPLFNKDLNAHRLGRMLRRIFEIETYRAMALLGPPEARRLAPVLGGYDTKLVELTKRNLMTPAADHKRVLEDITILSSHIISATAETRNRFGATGAYAKIVEERIALLRETHVPGFQCFGTFVERRLKSLRSEHARQLPFGWNSSHAPRCTCSTCCRHASRSRSSIKTPLKSRPWRITLPRRSKSSALWKGSRS